MKRKLAEQAQNPKGWFGRHIISRIFNKKNRDMERIGLELMVPAVDDRILEIGFGNGHLISEILLRIRNGKVCGIDISGDMVDMASRRNQKWIERGVLDIRKASVRDIPYRNAMFDKVFTANTIYFWPDPVADLNEVKRVLKPGGRFYCAIRPKSNPIYQHSIHRGLIFYENRISQRHVSQFVICIFIGFHRHTNEPEKMYGWQSIV